MQTNPKIRIEAINEKSPHLETVIALGDANKKTLGFLPKGAFKQHAVRRQILVALDPEENCLGYLLYRNSGDWTVIVHLCINPSYRGKGVAKKLVNYLKQRTKEFRGIKLSCRRDYHLEEMWSSFGFIAQHEVLGRGKKEKKPLTVWVLEYSPLPLISTMLQKQLESQLCVVIAPDIFLDLYLEKTEEPKVLLADWLQTEVTLCINNEIFNQINKISNSQERNKQRSFAQSFTCLDCDQETTVFQELHNKFSSQDTDIDELNLRYVIKTIISASNILITRNEKLLKLSNYIYENFKLSILPPEQLMANQLDELCRNPYYQPIRLAGTDLVRTFVKSGEEGFLADHFQNSQNGETKAKFQQQLRRFTAEVNKFDCFLIKDNYQEDIPLALIVYEKHKRHELGISMFRVGNHKLSITLAQHILFKSLLLSAREQRQFTRITDPYLQDAVIKAIQEFKFIKASNGWLKVNLPLVSTASELSQYLKNLVTNLGKDYKFLLEFSRSLTIENITSNVQAIRDIEKFLFPAKIADAEIPTFIIPIQPRWAKDLFDEHLANQLLPLAGVRKTELAFNREAVYYRSVQNPRGLKAPCRILWYVSGTQGEGKGKGFSQVTSVRACSYVDEVLTGHVKEIYQRFQRLGVYKLSDLVKITDKKGEVMAIRFSDTELFNKEVYLDELNEITNRKLYLQCPTKISKEEFIKVYNLGMDICGSL